MTGEKQQSPASITAKLDRTLHAIGFQYELVSPERIVGRLQVTETCCQPFDVLSGGVSALMAESMASLGAYVSSGFKRVAGVQLATNHLRAALLADIVEAEARLLPPRELCLFVLSFVLCCLPDNMFLRLLNSEVKSLISIPDSLREDKVAGTSSDTTLDSFSLDTFNLLKAFFAGKEMIVNVKNDPTTAVRTNRTERSPSSGPGRSSGALTGGDTEEWERRPR